MLAPLAPGARRGLSRLQAVYRKNCVASQGSRPLALGLPCFSRYSMKTLTLRALPGLLVALVMLLRPSPLAAQLGDNNLSYSDQDFVTQLYQEVIVSQKLASLAVNFGNKGSVRSLAARTTDSLRQIREQVRILARKKGVIISDELVAQNQDVFDRLSNATGDGFDRTYLDILLQYLPRIQSRCENIVSTTQDADLKALASSLIPAIKARVAEVEAVKSDL